MPAPTPAGDPPGRVVVVDDEPAIVEVAARVLEDAGFAVERAGDARTCLALTEVFELDAVLTDICMGAMDGFELIGALRARRPELRAVVMTAHDSYEMVRAALAAGAYDYLDKPLDRHAAIVATVARAVEATRLARRNARLLAELRGSNAKLAAANGRLVELNARLHRLAHTDPLTGLPNRRHLDATLARALARRAREPAPLAVALLDVDRFKAYNDRFGHDGGDRALRAVAAALRTCAAATDTVGRHGGEEFMAVLPGGPAGRARAWAERLRAVIEASTAGRTGDAGPLTVSLGVTELGAGDASADAASLLRAADAALYRAKEHGRNRVETAAPEAPRAAA